jgi:hypothetical protein
VGWSTYKTNPTVALAFSLLPILSVLILMAGIVIW